MEIQMAFELGNPEGWGAQAVLEIQVDGWSKNRAFHHGGVDFFWNNPFQKISIWRKCIERVSEAYKAVLLTKQPR